MCDSSLTKPLTLDFVKGRIWKVVYCQLCQFGSVCLSLCWNAVDLKRVAIKVAYCLFFRQMKESLLREICHIRLLALSTMCITFTQVDSYPHFIQLRLMKHSNGIWEKTKITILSAFIKKGGWEVGIYGVPSTMCYATSWVSMCKKTQWVSF